MKAEFAGICDKCDRRSQEYSSWFTCRICLDDICLDCGILFDDETGKCVCKECFERGK